MDKLQKIEKSEAKFSLEKLRNNCKSLFGVEIAVFDGSTEGLSGEYTIEDMRLVINDWMKKEGK